MAELETTGEGTPRTSLHIKRKPASNLYHAVRVAEWLGYPLNLFVTVNFALTVGQAERVSRAFERLRRNHFAPWLRRAVDGVVPATYVWVLEAAGGCVTLHWVLHLPEIRERDFAERLPLWLAAVGASPTEKAAIDIRDVPRLLGLRRYLLKGIDPMYAAFYGVEARAQGLVHGRRSGFSRNTGPAAKKRERVRRGLDRRGYWSWPKP